MLTCCFPVGILPIQSQLASALKHLAGVLLHPEGNWRNGQRSSHSFGSVFIYLGTLATNYISLYNLSSWVKSCNWSLVKNITNSNMAPKYFVMLFPFPFFHSSVRIIKMSHVSGEEKIHKDWKRSGCVRAEDKIEHFILFLGQKR